jgi:hypothetical protein
VPFDICPTDRQRERFLVLLGGRCSGKGGGVRAARFVGVALVVLLVALTTWFVLAGGKLVHVSLDHAHTTTFP